MHLHRTGSEWVVLAPAKLNLFFEVLGKRGDGYHEVETLVYPIDLYDTLYFREVSGGQIGLGRIDHFGPWRSKDFQAQEGLRSDGLAGAQTLIRINTMVGANVPRLSQPLTVISIPDKQSASAIDNRQPQRLARVSVVVE